MQTASSVKGRHATHPFITQPPHLFFPPCYLKGILYFALTMNTGVRHKTLGVKSSNVSIISRALGVSKMV